MQSIEVELKQAIQSAVKKAFDLDLNNYFKTVMKWNV